MIHTIRGGNWPNDVTHFLQVSQDGDTILSPHPLIAKWAENEKEKVCPGKQLTFAVTPRIKYRNVLPEGMR